MCELSPTLRIFRIFCLVALICVCFLLAAPVRSISALERDLDKRDFRDCTSCHEGIEAISPNHPFACAVCNQTRFLWGAQETAAPAIYGIKGPLEPLPYPDFSPGPQKPENLVDRRILWTIFCEGAA